MNDEPLEVVDQFLQYTCRRGISLERVRVDQLYPVYMDFKERYRQSGQSALDSALLALAMKGFAAQRTTPFPKHLGHVIDDYKTEMQRHGPAPQVNHPLFQEAHDLLFKMHIFMDHMGL